MSTIHLPATPEEIDLMTADELRQSYNRMVKHLGYPEKIEVPKGWPGPDGYDCIGGCVTIGSNGPPTNPWVRRSKDPETIDGSVVKEPELIEMDA